MLQIEIDGKQVSVKEGSNVIEAARDAGSHIPHFCYHKKLSIAANCRMCLVDVEKAPKPLPACATPVTQGMVVRTRTEKARKAQKAVLEFLLINHPLDCPICDQGGECKLQDLTMGYGPDVSRFREDKHVFVAKYMGPLISCQEMSRCIHCTRCVRFTTEIAGFQEIGMSGRGGKSEIMSFIGKTVDSEISGNVIDLCPVGALTSKPFRYSARSWELSRRRSVSPHDSLGSNLIVQTKNRSVKRVLPFENEQVNECWLSDRDRFSYEGLNSPDRLLAPRIKQDGKWREVDWTTAIEYVIKGLRGVGGDHGPDAIGFVASAMCTLEELHLAKKLARALGVSSVDHRLRDVDRRVHKARSGALWLGSPIAELSAKKAILVIGSNLRQEQPLLCARVRRACQDGAKVMTIGAGEENLRMRTYAQIKAHPAAWADLLGRLEALVDERAREFGAIKAERDRLVRERDEAIARAMEEGGEEAVKALPEVAIVQPALRMVGEPSSPEKTAEALGFHDPSEVVVLLGAEAQRHPGFYEIYGRAQALADRHGFGFGVLPEQANSVGADMLRFEPGKGGDDVFGMIERPKKAVVLMNVEPLADVAEGPRFAAALEKAETVIAMTAYDSPDLAELADVMLPISPFTETRGTFVNMEGRLQSFYATVESAGQSKPMWKVLRVLGTSMDLDGFAFDASDEVLKEALAGRDPATLLDNRVNVDREVPPPVALSGDDLVRVGGVGLYWSDPIVRRAPSLQRTVWGRTPVASINPATLEALSLADGDKAFVVPRGVAFDPGARAKAADSDPAAATDADPAAPAAARTAVDAGDAGDAGARERAGATSAPPPDREPGPVEVVVRADPAIAPGVVHLPAHSSNARLGSMMNAVNVVRGR